MSKRRDSSGKYYSPAKRQKLEITVENGSKSNYKPVVNKKEKDLWGDDFEEEVLQDLDLVASQAFSQEVNISVDESIKESSTDIVKSISKPSVSWPKAPNFNSNTNVPSPKKNSSPGISSTSAPSSPKPSTSTSFFQKFTKPANPSSKDSIKSYYEKESHVNHFPKGNIVSKSGVSSSETFQISQSTQNTVFDDFEKKLLAGKDMNSTFLSQKSVVVVSDDSQLELAKLKEENRKLLDDFTTKDGEVSFLRQQLQREQKKFENEQLAKIRTIEELENKHRAELLAVKKEKESEKTHLNFLNLQLNTLKEKCKMLEKGSVKLIEPHSVSTDPGNRSRINTTINRPGSSSKKLKVKESAIQAKVFDNSVYKLKTHISTNPLKNIPKSLFEISEPEKSIVDIHVVEKIGKRNIPIIQDEETLRLFEKPDLVKPVKTLVNNKELSVQFFLPHLTIMMNNTREEINSRESIFIINKIVSTTRELTLNVLISLRRIFEAMRNDDIRDMNDFYYADHYKIPITYNESIWEAKLWHDKERGIEARRSFAVLSYIVSTSTYLAEYITGKRRLKIEEDDAYNDFILQLTTYNSWSKKGCDFEFLEIILELVTTIGLTRRAHQFSGLINAIILTLNNTQEFMGFCNTGLDYTFKIFREIVFSRPLLVCFKPMSEMMMIFGSCSSFSEKLCTDSNSKAVCFNNQTWYFKPGPRTCTLEIFLVQMQKVAKDSITLLNITYAIVSFMLITLPMNVLPWREEQGNSCKCCGNLIRFTVSVLYQCLSINIEELEIRKKNSNILNEEFWAELKIKQQFIAMKGIQFFYYLSVREVDYVLRRTDMENSFHLFLHHVKNMKDLSLHEKERECLEKLEITDRILPTKNSSLSSKRQIICMAKTKTQVPVAPEEDFSFDSFKELRRLCLLHL